MIKNIVFLSLLSFSVNSFAFDIYSEIICLSSHGEKPINIKYVNVYSQKYNARLGYIKYEKSATAIPIVLVDEYYETFEDEPYVTTTVWNEIIQGKFNGTYTVVIHGPLFSFNYMNKNGKQIEFEERMDSYAEGMKKCAWE
ncbi:hypothetical protein [Xenorhabdus griffiniae]|uniref:Uncharacterized protein n=1 Tax=Xenorhabdus griffiniae TaxID=351672 RepID=A0ABY9XGH5_9GAMM|nr:hypothetical protein [Xenorhabdus griffiniae]MBD1228731.1 hypothetical protein [Xenorhabdus griffiniae]WMV71993.1 hypothetical protein QL128_18040 [Xenorhabdus griffiniae]WNH01670.1 hypothetical protein QL112_018045 [Xenorhabdus griffiniae]